MSAPRPDLVPADDAAARSFGGIIAILAFMAALAIAVAAALSASAAEWGTVLSREVTVQVLPRTGRDLDEDVARAAVLARATLGVVSATALSRRETDALLEPWFGAVLDLGDLPVPRLVVVRLGAATSADLAGLRTRLGVELPSARIDDHSAWLDSLAGTTRSLVWGACALVALVMVGTVFATTIATRGALAANRRTVEVLHWVGADDRFIVRVFAWRFFRLGLAGSAVGGAAAALVSAVLVSAVLGPTMRAMAAGPESREALAGAWAIGWSALASITAVSLTLPLASGLASRWSVGHLLRENRLI